MPTTPTSYDFYEDAYNIMVQNKPQPRTEDIEASKRRMKLNAIGEGLRSLGELAGSASWQAPVERRQPNQEVLRNLGEYNRLKAQDSADQLAWRNKLIDLKLRRAMDKARGEREEAKQKAINERNQEKEDKPRRSIITYKKDYTDDKGGGKGKSGEKDESIVVVHPYNRTQEFTIKPAQVNEIKARLLNTTDQPDSEEDLIALEMYRAGKLTNTDAINNLVKWYFYKYPAPYVNPTSGKYKEPVTPGEEYMDEYRSNGKQQQPKEENVDRQMEAQENIKRMANSTQPRHVKKKVIVNILMKEFGWERNEAEAYFEKNVQ